MKFDPMVPRDQYAPNVFDQGKGKKIHRHSLFPMCRRKTSVGFLVKVQTSWTMKPNETDIYILSHCEWPIGIPNMRMCIYKYIIYAQSKQKQQTDFLVTKGSIVPSIIFKDFFFMAQFDSKKQQLRTHTAVHQVGGLYPKAASKNEENHDKSILNKMSSLAQSIFLTCGNKVTKWTRDKSMPM